MLAHRNIWEMSCNGYPCMYTRGMTTTTETTSPVSVGNIFVSAWGYDQTNIDFYQVVAVSKTGRAKIQKIDRVVTERGCPSDTVVPVPDAFIGEATGYKTVFTSAYDDVPRIKICSYARASRVALNAEEAATVTARETNSAYGH